MSDVTWFDTIVEWDLMFTVGYMISGYYIWSEICLSFWSDGFVK